MRPEDVTGRVHSVQSLGTLDGPGVRCVVFLQGCPLRCRYCHNPDTWEAGGGEERAAGEVFEQVLRCRAYFGRRGGLTVSGGEALLQPAFTRALFTLCRAEGIHTALDTSGCRVDEAALRLLAWTDLVLLDIKRNTEEDCRAWTGGGLRPALDFLEACEARGVPVWVRQVVVPGVNDTRAEMDALCALLVPYPCVKRVELLPFRKLCLEKYDRLGIPFPLRGTPEADSAAVAELARYVEDKRGG